MSPGARARAEKGELAFGTVDAYLVWRLTGGAVHATDVTNASRTLLMNLRTLEWDDEMLRALPRARARCCPRSSPSAGAIATTRDGARHCPTASPSPASRAISRRRSSGRPAFSEGDAKCTYGTGAFMLCNTGSRPVREPLRSAHHGGVEGRRPRSSTRSKAARSSRAPRCSGCATVSGSSRAPADIEALARTGRLQRGREVRAGARRVSARPTGTPVRAGSSPGSREAPEPPTGARHARGHRAPRSTIWCAPWPTISELRSAACGSTEARRPTTS